MAVKSKSKRKKGKRVIISLESTSGSKHRYYTYKNTVNTPDKLELMKFDPIARKRVAYKEKKLPPHSK